MIKEETKKIVENVGSTIFVNLSYSEYTLPEVISMYNLNLIDVNNPGSYSVLGHHNLSDKLDYSIEKGFFSSNLDDLKQGIIRDNRETCKNMSNYDRIDIASSKKDLFSVDFVDQNCINKFLSEHNEIREFINLLDSKYLRDSCIYQFDNNTISRNRLLKNLCNYKGKDDILNMVEECLRYKSNCNNIEEVINLILPLLKGMGEKENVKLSKGI